MGMTRYILLELRDIFLDLIHEFEGYLVHWSNVARDTADMPSRPSCKSSFLIYIQRHISSEWTSDSRSIQLCTYINQRLRFDSFLFHPMMLLHRIEGIQSLCKMLINKPLAANYVANIKLCDMQRHQKQARATRQQPIQATLHPSNFAQKRIEAPRWSKMCRY